MKYSSMICAALIALSLASPAQAEPSAFFISPKNGETVSGKVKIKFGIKGIKIRPAGEDVNDKKTGHHHLIIDGSAVAEGQPVPTDDTHKHFGKGQTETELELAPGVHNLTLQFADGAHLSYGPKLSQTIKIEVK